MSFLSGLIGAKNNFKAEQAKTDTTAYGSALSGFLSQVGNVQGQQQTLANQLRQQAQGIGPSLVGEQLRQGTAANIAAERGALAGAKGINRGQAARATAEGVATMGTAAAGQSALARLQEQLAARQQEGGVLQGMGNTNVAALGATAQAQNQQNANTIQNTIETNKINAGVSAQNANTNAALAGGLMNAAGAAVGLAKGGTVPKLSGGGDPFPDYSHMYTAGAEGFSKGLGSMADRERKSYGAAEADKSSVDKIIAGLPEPSTTPYTMPEGVVAGPPAMAHGGHLGALLRMIDGGHIPGVATHPGDNLKNDTQPAMLSPGEYVEPRSVVKKPGMKQALEAVRKNPDLASEFVKMVRAKQGKRA